MTEIKLQKRAVYVADVYAALVKVGYEDATYFLQGLPSADVTPVRHGEWAKSEDDWNCLTTITCSECHEEWCFETEEDVELLNYRYCPNCGARMDGGAGGEK